MKVQKDNRDFWNHIASNYEKSNIENNKKAYDDMLRLIILELDIAMNVLEIATGTGYVALRIAQFCNHIEATDFSEEMIKITKSREVTNNLSFSIQDATELDYPDNTFNAVIISNALHVMPNPQKALVEIRRVLKEDGVLIAPTFTKSDSFIEKMIEIPMLFVGKMVGFKTFSKWTYEQYLDFIRDNHWVIEKSNRVEARFPLAYVVAKKTRNT